MPGQDLNRRAVWPLEHTNALKRIQANTTFVTMKAPRDTEGTK
jgi:hypothetical protein